jgi:hypothetical protein
MPHTNQKPGTERFRDEQRKDNLPKQNGAQWTDEDRTPSDSDLQRDIAPDVESSPEVEGMGKGKTHPGRTSNK